MSRKSKKFDVHYYAKVGGVLKVSHTYSEKWVHEELHCPGCGELSVWREDAGGGDYYVGETYICTTCSSRFKLPIGVDKITDDEDKQRLAELAKGKA